MLRNVVGDEGSLSVPLLLGSLSELNPFVSQLLIAGFIRLRPSVPGNDNPLVKLVYDVTDAGRAASE